MHDCWIVIKKRQVPWKFCGAFQSVDLRDLQKVPNAAAMQTIIILQAAFLSISSSFFAYPANFEGQDNGRVAFLEGGMFFRPWWRDLESRPFRKELAYVSLKCEWSDLTKKLTMTDKPLWILAPKLNEWAQYCRNRNACQPRRTFLLLKGIHTEGLASRSICWHDIHVCVL